MRPNTLITISHKGYATRFCRVCEVHLHLQNGSIKLTDHYWHEGMTEPKPLAELFTKIKISREGWNTRVCRLDEVEGSLNLGSIKLTDHYWHEGMTEPKPLAQLLQIIKKDKMDREIEITKKDKKDREIALINSNVKIYQMEADLGFGKSQQELAQCYVYGRGVERDLIKAYAYYSLALLSFEEDYAVGVRNLRAEIAHGMTFSQIQIAKELAVTLQAEIVARAKAEKK